MFVPVPPAFPSIGGRSKLGSFTKVALEMKRKGRPYEDIRRVLRASGFNKSRISQIFKEHLSNYRPNKADDDWWTVLEFALAGKDYDHARCESIIIPKGKAC